MSSNDTELRQVVHRSDTAGAVGVEGLVSLIPDLTAEYLLPSQRIPVVAAIYSLPLRSKYLFTLHCGTINPSDMWRFTFEIWGAAQLSSFTDIAPKSPFLCVNRSPIWCDFCVGATAIRYLSNRPHLLWVYRRDNPRGMLGEHEKSL